MLGTGWTGQGEAAEGQGAGTGRGRPAGHLVVAIVIHGAAPPGQTLPWRTAELSRMVAGGEGGRFTKELDF